MTLLNRIVLVVLCGAIIFPVSSQEIDAGRGPVPIVVPSGYDQSKPAPLVVLLHGYTSSGAGQDRYMKFGTLAEAYGYLFVAPDGTKEKSDNSHRFWNASKACCDFYMSKVDDSAYLRLLIDEVKKRYSVDVDRVYLIGHSNGGFMSHRMAVDHPDVIAAIASLNGAAPMVISGAKAERPVSILHIHGTDDELNDYRGGDIRDVPYPGAVQTVELWAEFNGVSTEATILPEKLDLDRNLEGEETTATQYGDGLVELWTINDGGHIPALSDKFSNLIIEWLMAHPKASGQ